MHWQDFDLEGRVKVPLGYYLLLLYLLRGYLVWVVSLTFGDNRSLLLSYAYPEIKYFVLVLLTGLPALLNFCLFSLRKQAARNWYQVLWHQQSRVLFVALLLDVTIQTVLMFEHLVQLHSIQVLVYLAGCYLLWYWLSSNKVRRFFNNWLT